MAERDERKDNEDVDKATGRWRLSGITSRAEVEAWVKAGVFDAARAGLLRMAGVRPVDIDGLRDEHGRNIGHEFACGALSYAEVLAIVRRHGARVSRSGTIAKPAGPVLLIDDEPDSRSGIAELLRSRGYDALEFANGREALDYLFSDAPKPGVIVLDLAMPVMSGWEFLAVVKSFTRLSDIPTIVISGKERPKEAVRFGVIRSFLEKPLDPESLTSFISSSLSANWSRTA